jgi:hypothetical protein
MKCTLHRCQADPTITASIASLLRITVKARFSTNF